jgi:hypothetical protein
MLKNVVQGMAGLIGQALRAPITIFAATMEAVAKAVGEMQSAFNASFATLADGSQRVAPVATSTFNCRQESERSQNYPNLKENSNMSDEDLGGDDLKLVRWAISFTKRDVEIALNSGIELVDYSTDKGSFAGSKKDEFLQKLRTDHIPRPARWKREEYPPKQYIVGDEVVGLPQDDVDKFMRVYVEVLDRYQKAESHYEKDEAKALTGIRNILDTRLPKAP